MLAGPRQKLKTFKVSVPRISVVLISSPPRTKMALAKVHKLEQTKLGPWDLSITLEEFLTDGILIEMLVSEGPEAVDILKMCRLVGDHEVQITRSLKYTFGYTPSED